MKVFSLAVMALLGHVNAVNLKDMDEGVADLLNQTENYAEIQERNKEVKAAWNELELKQLQADTKTALSSVEDSQEKERKFDMEYQRYHGFMPNKFEIVNDVQIKDDVEDASKAEVIAAQKDVEMQEAADKLEKNQKLLQEAMRKQRESDA